jgi:hypothetical protein
MTPRQFLHFVAFIYVAISPAMANPAVPRVAVLPTISDMGTRAAWRPWTKSFDAALQAELLEGWEASISSRAGLTTVVFEQRLAIAKGERKEPPQVPAADFLCFVVLDSKAGELRVHVAPIGQDMRETGKPVIHRFKDARNFATDMPSHVAKDVAARMGLKKRNTQAAPNHKAAAPEAIRLAIIPPFSSMPGDHPASGMVPILTAMLEEACLQAGPSVDLVERQEINSLLEEKELAASGIATNGLNPVNAADVARLAGARFILVPFLFPTNGAEARVTVHAIDSLTGRVVAAKTWQQKVGDEVPSAIVGDLLAMAATRQAGTKGDPSADAAMRHAEAAFVGSLRRTLNELRADFRERMEIRLLLADAAIALAHDDVDLLATTLHEFLFSLSWEDRLSIEFDHSKSMAAYRAAKNDGTLAEMHRQTRRIFEAPLREMHQQRGETMDRVRLAHFLTMTERPAEAADLLMQLPRDNEGIIQHGGVLRYFAEALIENDRLPEATALLEEHDRRFITDNRVFYLLCNLHRANGDAEKEINLMFRDHRERMKVFQSPQLARFLEIARLHERPDICLAAFQRHSHDWYRNDPAVVAQLIRHKMFLKQTDAAIEDARSAHLASVIGDEPEHAATFLALIKELGAEPITGFSLPAESIQFPQGTRIDLFHDTTLTAERARNIATHLARFWGCEVHLVATPLDLTTLECHQRLSRRTDGQKLVHSLHPLMREDPSLLQTIFLTSLPLSVDRGAVFSATSRFGPLLLCSTHYTDHFHKPGNKPTHAIRLPELDEKVVISMQGGIIRRVMDAHHIKNTSPQVPFRPLPPDPFASNGTLGINDRLFGVSPATARLLGEIPPATFLETSRESRAKLLESLAADDSPDTRAVRSVKGSDPVVIRP